MAEVELGGRGRPVHHSGREQEGSRDIEKGNLVDGILSGRGVPLYGWAVLHPRSIGCIKTWFSYLIYPFVSIQ